MSEKKGLSGPDLTEGVDAAALDEAGKLVGHAEGEPVLLVKLGDEICAIGAKCTHYGGPLGEGLIVGDTVRCPWHHACFSLRTGQMLRPPALADVPRWKVVRENGRIRVAGKEQTKPQPPSPKVSPKSVLIVGAGAAGNMAAETLRREGYSGPITMLDPDKDAPYDRPNLSKDYLAGTAPEAWIPLHSPAYYAKRNIDIVRLSAAAIDVGGKRLKLSDGSEREWDALLLAPGAEPVRLAMPVAPGANLHLLRTLADSRTIVAAAEAGQRAVIIGSSFIGLEVAASLRKREVAVQVVAPEDKPLARIMGPALGDFVRSVHEENGVEFCLGHTAKEIRPGSVVLDDGTELQADFVVMGVGVRPRVDLARNAGLAVENGIVADEFLQTSQPGIWAAGDAASWPDPHTGQRIRVEHWVLAERMGQTAARNILGARERFEAVPFFWSQHYGDTINYVGHGAGWDEASLDGNPADRDCAVTFRRGGKRIAVATIFRDVESLRVEAEMEREVE